MPRDRYQNEILDALNSAGAPLTAQELAARLDMKGGGERRALDAALAALERAGEVVQNRAGALLVAKRIALVAGRIEGHADGHGFLGPDDGSPRVFLPPAAMREVIHGDRAAVSVSGRGSRGRPDGNIDAAIERGKQRLHVGRAA